MCPFIRSLFKICYLGINYSPCNLYARVLPNNFVLWQKKPSLFPAQSNEHPIEGIIVDIRQTNRKLNNFSLQRHFVQIMLSDEAINILFRLHGQLQAISFMHMDISHADTTETYNWPALSLINARPFSVNRSWSEASQTMACVSSRIIEAPRANRLPTGEPSGHRQKKHPSTSGPYWAGPCFCVVSTWPPAFCRGK